MSPKPQKSEWSGLTPEMLRAAAAAKLAPVEPTVDWQSIADDLAAALFDRSLAKAAGKRYAAAVVAAKRVGDS